MIDRLRVRHDLPRASVLLLADRARAAVRAARTADRRRRARARSTAARCASFVGALTTPPRRGPASLLARKSELGRRQARLPTGLRRPCRASFDVELADAAHETRRREGKRIAAYGASAKGSTLLNYFGIGSETLDFVVDRSTVKQGRYMPGVHLPIYPPAKLLEDHARLCPAADLELRRRDLAQQARVPPRGGKFIIPVPEPDGGVSDDRRRPGRSRSDGSRTSAERSCTCCDANDPHFIEFGEIYFSTRLPGVVKGWHRHREMTLNYACVSGRVKLVLYDDARARRRAASSWRSSSGRTNYSLVVIPPDSGTGSRA